MKWQNTQSFCATFHLFHPVHFQMPDSFLFLYLKLVFVSSLSGSLVYAMQLFEVILPCEKDILAFSKIYVYFIDYC